MHTSIHLIPRDEPEWMPDEVIVRALMDQLGTTEVWAMEAYSKPLDWDAEFGETVLVQSERAEVVEVDLDSGIGTFRVFERQNVGVEEAIGLWKEYEAKCTLMHLTCDEWSHGLCETLRELAEKSTTGHFVACEPSVYIGPSSIPDPWCEKTVARVFFQVSLGGDGMPDDWDEYLAAALATAQISSLLRFLRERSQIEWRAIMSSSY